ncbi:MAG: 2-hydroxyacyl-CoA dehydratase [Desulfobacterales bacterium]|nr:2-hydroxyacyl-CoA dehydratase [Desulfobacterales bacterium]
MFLSRLSEKIKNYFFYIKYISLIRLEIFKLFFYVIFTNRLKVLKANIWLKKLLKAQLLFKLLIKAQNKLEAEIIYNFIKCFINYIKQSLNEKIILCHNDIPSEIIMAMGLNPVFLNGNAFLSAILYPQSSEDYRNSSEILGIPSDICSNSKIISGFIITNYPQLNSLVIASNIGCTSLSEANLLICKKNNHPLFIFDIPNFSEKPSRLTDELNNIIEWVKSETNLNVDYEKLKYLCINRNKVATIMNKLNLLTLYSNIDIGGEALIISNLWNLYPLAFKILSVKFFENMLRVLEKKVIQKDESKIIKKNRVLILNFPDFNFIDIILWAKKTYGFSFFAYPPLETYNEIDISSEKSIIKGLAESLIPDENFMMDEDFANIHELHKDFNIKMIWILNDKGCPCKSAKNVFLEEKFREHKIPFLSIEHNSFDFREIAINSIINKIEFFLENIGILKL